MRVLLDIDGVLADFIGGACKLHGRSQGGLAPLLGMSAGAFYAPMGQSFWAGLTPLPWMRDVVTMLEGKFGVENICLLTAPILTPGCFDGKLEWINTHLPQYRRRYLVGPAKHFCASESSLLIDDNTTNVLDFTKAGGKGFLFPNIDALSALHNYLEGGA